MSPFILLERNSFFNTEVVRLVELSSATQAIQAFRNGVINAAALTLDETIQLLGSGEEITIVLMLDISNGGDVILGQKDVYQLSDLQGKKVAVEGTALGAYVLLRALEKEDIPPNNVTPILTDYSQHEHIFNDKNIATIVTFYPIAAKLINKGANILFDSTDIPGEIVDVLVVSNNYLANNLHTVQQVVDAWYQSLAYMKSDPQEVATIINRRLKLSINEVHETYKKLILASPALNREYLQSSPQPRLLITADKLSSMMIERNLIQSTTENKKLFEKSNLLHQGRNSK